MLRCCHRNPPSGHIDERRRRTDRAWCSHHVRGRSRTPSSRILQTTDDGRRTPNTMNAGGRDRGARMISARERRTTTNANDTRDVRRAVLPRARALRPRSCIFFQPPTSSAVGVAGLVSSKQADFIEFSAINLFGSFTTITPKRRQKSNPPWCAMHWRADAPTVLAVEAAAALGANRRTGQRRGRGDRRVRQKRFHGKTPNQPQIRVWPIALAHANSRDPRDKTWGN